LEAKLGQQASPGSSSSCADQQLLPPSCQQLVWSSPARVPLAIISSSKALPPAFMEHAPDDSSLTGIEIRNSYCPSMPVLIGKFVAVTLDMSHSVTVLILVYCHMVQKM
jgi:hypothetical protein